MKISLVIGMYISLVASRREAWHVRIAAPQGRVDIVGALMIFRESHVIKFLK